MTYQVVAPLVLAKDPEGKVHERYADATIAWLSPEQEKHFLDLGLVVKVDDDGEPAEEEDGAPDESWKRPEIDAWAAENLELDTSGEPNKAAALAAIAEHLED